MDRRRFCHPPCSAAFVSISSRFRNILHVSYAASWKSSRAALILWGLLNGFGLGLLTGVRRVSRRVPRVSGSFSA